MAEKRDPVWEAARAGDPDRYLAALYAPRERRDGLMALAAFGAEMTRIPLTVREPLLAEIRLQWWRDALDLAPDTVSGAPVADALRRTMLTAGLPLGLLHGMIDAASSQAASAPVKDEQSLRSLLHKSEGAQLVLAARVLGATTSDTLETAAAEGGYALGIGRLIRDLGAAASLGRVLLPESLAARHGSDLGHWRQGLWSGPDQAVISDIAAEGVAAARRASRLVERLDKALLPAFLPLAAAPARLANAAASASNPLRNARPDDPLARWWRLWRAQLRGTLVAG